MTDFLYDGMLFGFKTRPFNEFAPPETGRYGAIKIIGSNRDTIVVATLDGVFERMPTAEEVRATNILLESRFAFDGRQSVFGVFRDWWTSEDLAELTFLSKAHVNRDERRLADIVLGHKVGAVSGPLSIANSAVEGEWRWVHDHAALVSEQDEMKEKRLAIQRAKEERYNNRLRGLTWDQLLSEVPFERWTGTESYPNEEFTSKAREKIKATIREIESLGPKPTKKLVRAKLKECVIWFNEADEAHGGPIETEEREDICLLLEEIAFVAKQKSLTQEIDEWRTW